MDRQIEIAWGDREVKVIPNMELAHKIENIISVPRYIMTLESNFKVVETVRIIHAVLEYADIKATEEEVYNEISSVPFAEVIPIMIEILQKVFPMFFSEANTGKKKKARKK